MPAYLSILAMVPSDSSEQLMWLCCSFGTIVGAITGATAFSRVRMDIFGIIVCGMIVALGGGTVRDLLLSGVINPETGKPVAVYWTTPGDVQYVYQAFITSLVVFYVSRFWKMPVGTIRVADAFSMSFFTLLGMSKAMHLGLPCVVCIIMGMCTGVIGGVMRDVLTGNVPYIFRSKEVYATASFSGCIAYLIFQSWFRMGEDGAFLGGIAVVFCFRMVAVWMNWKMPSYRPLFADHQGQEGDGQEESGGTDVH